MMLPHESKFVRLYPEPFPFTGSMLYLAISDHLLMSKALSLGIDRPIGKLGERHEIESYQISMKFRDM